MQLKSKCCCNAQFNTTSSFPTIHIKFIDRMSLRRVSLSKILNMSLLEHAITLFISRLQFFHTSMPKILTVQACYAEGFAALGEFCVPISYLQHIYAIKKRQTVYLYLPRFIFHYKFRVLTFLQCYIINCNKFSVIIGTQQRKYVCNTALNKYLLI